MKIAYLDCSSGISGDMCLGALVDAGVPLSHLGKGLKALPVKGYRLTSRKVHRASIAATKVDVIVQDPRGRGQRPEAKRWKDVKGIIETSSLPEPIRQQGLRIFRGLFVAEGKMHGESYARTHLHELGALDCIVDIFGTLIGLDYLGISEVHASPVNLGSGFVRTEHGRLPVPAPATAELLRDRPVYASDTPFELTTPTGAALVKELAGDFGPMPLMNVRAIGYGAGQKDIEKTPNVLRIFVGDRQTATADGGQKITVIETNIDDMNPQIYEHLMERLLASGCLDVYLTQVIMKKGRPGIVLTVLCPREQVNGIADLILRESSTIGLRLHEASRIILDRQVREVKTKYGTVRVKVSKTREGMTKVSPEYEDCKRIAQKQNVPLIEVMKAAARPK